MLVSNTLFHRYTSPLAPHYAVSQLQSTFYSAVISHSPLYATHCQLVVRRLTEVLLLNTGLICYLCLSQIFNCVTISLLEVSGTLSISLKGTGILAALMSEALWGCYTASRHCCSQLQYLILMV